MKKLIIYIVLGVMIASCSKVPITNRKQTNLMKETSLIKMSKQQYTDFLAKSKVLPDSDPRAQRVARVGELVKNATVSFLTKKGYAKRLEGFEWEFKTVDDSIMNAWCMPGGKVCFYTALLDLCDTDDEVAVVLGHEISHAIARHGNERMSNQMVVNRVGRVLAPHDTTQVSLFQKVFMGSASLGMLKYGRSHETEADKLGLVFMDLAGYNPEAAIGFWEKMAATGGKKPPEIFSTHPSDARRIADIKEFLTEIEAYTR